MQARNRTILVVEDNTDHALLIRIATRRVFPGLDIRVAGDGREGIAYIAGTPPFQDRRAHPHPDLVILDLVMPETDGFGVLEWAGANGIEVPLVVLTSSVNPGDETRSLELGARAFHTKPADLDELGLTVKSIVERWLT